MVALFMNSFAQEDRLEKAAVNEKSTMIMQVDAFVFERERERKKKALVIVPSFIP